MTLIKELRGFIPKMGKDCFLAENATLIGNITMGDQCSIWYGAVLRGDVNAIILGNKVNIQDNATVHCTFEKAKTIVGNNVTVGHNAIIHGCILHDNVLIGMGAIVLDDAVVESGSIVAAGAVVTSGTLIGKGELWAGIPAKKIKDIDIENQKNTIERLADSYVEYAKWYK